jgi:hypothetical protein
VIATLLSLLLAAHAEPPEVIAEATPEASAAPGRERPRPLDARTWGVEINAVWPVVPGIHIFTLKASYRLWRVGPARGELLFGFLGRPWVEDENAERISEIGGALGYRQYVWRGANVELALYPTWLRARGNFADGQDHDGFALTTEFYAGWRFDLLPRKKVGVYLIPQAGVGVDAVATAGPRSVPPSAFPVGNLHVGVTW